MTSSGASCAPVTRTTVVISRLLKQRQSSIYSILYVATSTEAAWKPRLEPNAVGWQETDPEGVIFLKKSSSAQYTYAQPDFSDPGLEKWKEPEAKQEPEAKEPEGNSSTATSTDTSGWSRDKIFKDIRDTAKAEKFTAAQVEEWEALFDFHMRFQSPESLQMAPHVLSTATTGASMTLHGMPIPWDDMWATLRRLPRAHLQTAPTSQATSQATANSTADSSSTSSGLAKGVALENSVTGTNHPKRNRERDLEAYKMQVAVSQLPLALSTLEVGELYFIALPDFEGEMSVGMGRVSSLSIVNGKVASAQVEWLTRRGWSNDVKDKGFPWLASPMFDPYKPDGKVAKNTHPICDFLPVIVELTEGSMHIKGKILADKKQRFCVVAKCVDRLREFCVTVRTELRKQSSSAKKPRRQ